MRAAEILRLKMAQIAKISEQVQLKSSGRRFYEFIKNMDCLPRMFPENFKGYEIVEGHGFTHGSVVLWKYDFGIPLEVKERRAVDDVNKSISMECLEGDLFRDFEELKVNLQVVDNDSNGSSVNWFVEFVKANEDVAPPYNYLHMGVKASKGIDAYLCNNSTN